MKHFIKKSIYVFFVLFISIGFMGGFMGCSKKKDELSELLKNYPKEMVEEFYSNGMIKAESYDKNKLGTVSAVEEFFINPMPESETQYNNECGAMSSAYVLRFYGENEKGMNIYKQIENKNPDGTISPKPLKQFWDSKNDYEMYVCKGTINDLKDAVSHNIPVIVLINCPGGWHYVPVVGFDKNYIYIHDSVFDFRNVTGEFYDRKESYKDFEKLWSVILPESDHLMFIATPCKQIQ